MNTAKVFAVGMLLAAGAAVAAPERLVNKVIAYGWDTIFCQPEDVLANAEALDATPIDGVGTTIIDHSVFQPDVVWTKETCARYVRRAGGPQERVPPVTQILGPELTDKFSMWRVAGGGILSLPRDRAVAVVTEGTGEVNGLAVKKGDRLIVAGERQLAVTGAATLVVCA